MDPRHHQTIGLRPQPTVNVTEMIENLARNRQLIKFQGATDLEFEDEKGR